MKSTNDKRKTKRRPVLDTFSIFVTLPQKGFHRLRIFDLSEDGMGFELDTEGESADGFAVAAGQVIDLRLYLNQSLFLPVAIEVVRIDETHGARRVGGVFAEKSSKAYIAFSSFLRMLDTLPDVAEIERPAATDQR